MKHVWNGKVKRILALVLTLLLTVQLIDLKVLAVTEGDNSESEQIPEGVQLNYHEMDEEVPSFAEEDAITAQSGAWSSLPSSYSGSADFVGVFEVQRDYVTPVKDQSGGTCWAYASTSVAESNYLLNGLGGSTVNSDNTDFDDLRLAYFTYYTPVDPLGLTEGDGSVLAAGQNYKDVGGNMGMAMCMYANWVGTSNESGFAAESVTPENATELAYEQDTAHLENGYIIAMPDMDTDGYQLDMDVVKEMIMNYGSVAISYYAGGGSYCYQPEYTPSNHAVTIVGWDDNLSAGNFPNTPPGNGAWLVKNSWGNYSGIDGYFWLSYYDATIANAAYVWDFASKDNYDNNYQYDGSPNSGAYLLANSQYVGANAFVADSREILKAVSFYTRDLNMEYEVRIYKNLATEALPQTGTLVLTQSGTQTYTGYHTIRLNSEIPLAQGERYAVVVTLKKPGASVEMTIDRSTDWTWVKFNSSAKKGQSYSGTTVDLLSDLNSNNSELSDGWNVRIKAFTDDVASIPVTGVTLNKSIDTLNSGGTLQLAAAVAPINADNKAVTWKSSDSSIVTVDDKGLVTANKTGKVGSANVTVTTVDGSKTATCKVTVNSVSVTGITLNCTQTTVNKGGTVTITATVAPSNATNKKVTWKSDNAAVATVSSNGVVTAVKSGTANITVTTGDGSKTASCKVTVKRELSSLEQQYAAVYDFDYYCAKYSDIRRIFGNNPEGAIAHFIYFGMNEARQGRAEFEVNSYRNQYVDLRRAFGNDLKSYYMHYMLYGKNEGRKGTGCTSLQGAITTYKGVDYSAIYNYNYYIEKYGDMKVLYGSDDEGAIAHFAEYGMHEGRQGNSEFEVNSYRNQYADLRRAFGNDVKSYYMHYMLYGNKEGRQGVGCTTLQGAVTTYKGVDYSAVYDYNYYITRYGDMKILFGNDDMGAISHFVEYGMSEGRQASSGFNMNNYKNRYADLRNAFGSDLKSYYMHYLYFGRAEGRKAY